MSLRAAGLRFVLFALGAVALTVFIGAQILGVTTRDTYPLHAVFADASGVRQGDPVRLAGVPVGSVTRVEVDRGRARVSVAVDRDVVLPTDTLVAVSWHDLTGRRQLDLHPGDEDTTLAPGDEIDRTRAAADLGQLTADVGPLVRVLDPERLNALLTSVDQVLSASGDDLVGLTEDVAGILDTVAARDAALDQMIRDYGDVTATLAEREQQVRRVVDDLVAVSEAFDGTDELLGRTVEDTAAVLGALDELLATNGDDLGRLVDDLAVLVSTASARADELEAGLQQLPDALGALYGVVSHGDHVRVDAVCAAFEEPPAPCVLSRDPAPGATSLSRDPSALGPLLLGRRP